MTFRSRTKIALAALLFLSWSSHPQERGGTLSWPEAKGEPIVLFAVWPPQKGKIPPDAIIDSILAMDNEHYIFPPAYDYTNQVKSDAVYEGFEKKYFSKGLKYPLFFGGSRQGYLVINGLAETGCIGLAATVDPVPPLKFTTPNMGLASTSESFHVHNVFRRFATSAERLQVIKLANHYFERIGIQRQLLRKTKIEELVATDVKGGRRTALIGSLSVLAPEARHRLFLIVERNSKGAYEIALPRYHVTEDLSDGKDEAMEQFVDQLDLDGDGADDVITIVSYYESHEYQIYKQYPNGWPMVYKGGGGGC